MFDIPILADYSDSVLLIARVILGITMIYYGWPKIKDLKANAEDFVKMGFKPGMFWGTIIALVEFVGGIFLIAGFLVSLVATLVAVEMIVGTIYKIKSGKSFKNWSYDLLILAIALLLLTFGGGIYGAVI